MEKGPREAQRPPEAQTTMARMTGAQALVSSLVAEGVDTVFAVPGYQAMNAVDALFEARDRIRTVHTRHEQATTFMADGYAKATGKVGVAMVVPGPGALYATAGLSTAFASSSPVLLLSCQVPSTAIGRRLGHLHEIDDQLDAVRPVTKWARRVSGVDEIPEAVHEAMRQLTTGRPRPVELEVPMDFLEESSGAEILPAKTYPRQEADPSAIRRAAEVLASAERVTIVAGGGATISGASDALLQVAEFLQAPVVTTEDSKGVIPEDHPLSAGAHYYGLGLAFDLLPETDALLVVGSRMFLDELEELSFSADQKIVQIDIDPNEIGKAYPVEVGIVADARAALEALLRTSREVSPARPSRGDQFVRQRDAYMAGLRERAGDQTGIVETMQASVGDDAIVVSGMTNIGYWSHLAYRVSKPRTYLTPGYAGTLGFAFPTALGAKVARPETPVVALCGDGGFMYAASELSTAVRHGINVVSVVFNNDGYGASMWDQQTRFEGRYLATDLLNPDFVKLAESFGAVGMRAEPDRLGEALSEALAADAPVVLEVPVPVMPPPF